MTAHAPRGDAGRVACLRVGLHPSVLTAAEEVKYALRTLLRIAGFAVEFITAAGDEGHDGGDVLDIFYGPPAARPTAAVRIAALGLPFDRAGSVEPIACPERDGSAILDFGGSQDCGLHREDGALVFTGDIVFACYWLLTGAREPAYRRDRRDNLDAEGSALIRLGLLSRPLVSIYAALLREYFRGLGRAPLDLPWTAPGARGAFAFTHDVDYPEIIRWIECLRLLKSRGAAGLSSIAGVARGTNHFWKFAEWVELAAEFGTRPAFYFMARRGSLLRYALGTPDAFYDIRTPAFARLFRELRDAGAEIGLHASYHAHRSVAALQQERSALEEAAGVSIVGNRHHYWHLDPVKPHETLRKHGAIGLLYDSSLAFEFYPGFRRGTCHPFHPFDPTGRRELETVQLPPAWMDDHFDRRLNENGIADPDAWARELIGTAQATGGVVVVDYHVRGMNADFFPRCGPWLARFVREALDSSWAFHTPLEIARSYATYEASLTAASLDRTAPAMSTALT